MRFLTVTLLGAVTLLGYTTIVLAGKIPPPKDVNELIDQYTIAPPCKKTCRTTRAPPPTSTRAPPPTSTRAPPPTSTPVPPGGPCKGDAVCVQKHLCSNVSTLGVGNFDDRSRKDNPCGDNLLQCCNPEDIIQEPDGDHTTVPSVSTTLTPIVKSPGCGKRNPKGVIDRITGGNETESEYGEFPWMMAILKTEEVLGQQRKNVYKCGGSLIHKQVVLTAAHCLKKIRASELIVRGGEWDTQTTRETFPHQERSITEIVTHPEYYKGGNLNDVALLFLDSPFELNSIIQPVCLPPQDTNFDHQTCVVSGWGKDTFGKSSPVQAKLKNIDLPIVPNGQCQSALRNTELGPRFTLDDSFNCAGGVKGKDTCKGDGGSPLVCPIPNKQHQYYQTGIVSWGIGCGENGVPGAYGNVAMFRNWIDQHMIQRNFGTSSYSP